MITDGTMQKATKSTWCSARRCRLVTSVAMLATVLAGCSTDLFGSRSTATTGSTSPFSGVGDFFRGKPEKTAADTPSDSNIDCPSVELRQGASTYSLNASGDQSALSVRFEATFGQTARECHASAGMLTIKVGVQGRVIVGPAGTPGAVSVPLRYALVQEGIQPKTLWTKFYSVPVDVPSGQTNVPFTHIQEDVVVSLPKPAELEAYVIYVGFDPAGLPDTTKKPRSKPKPKTSAAASGQLSTR